MESNMRGIQGPLAAGDIFNCSRVIRHKMHGGFPISYMLVEVALAMF